MFNLRNVLVVLAVVAVSGVAFGSGPSEFAKVVKPVSAEASEEYFDGSLVYSAEKAIDGSGLTVTLDTGDPATKVTSSVTHHGFDSAEDDGWDTYYVAADSWIEVDLGSSMNEIEGLWLWNGISSADSGDPATKVKVEVSSDKSNYADMGVFTLAQVPTYDQVSVPEYLGFSSMQDSVRYVKVTITEVRDDGEYDYTGMREIRIAQAPEPMTMSLLAVGGLALLRRRSR